MKTRHSAILLAAGRSSRMGMAKGLLPWRGITLFEYQVMQLLASQATDVVVVLGHDPLPYMKLARQYPVKVVWNKNFDQGKTSSILCGLPATNKETESIAIVAVDQPVSSVVIDSLITFMQTNASLISIPIYQNKRGHPVLFSQSMYDKLLQITEQTSGLRQLLHECKDEIAEVTVADPAVLFNLNTPEDYLNAIASEGRNECEDITNRTGFS